jgi:lipid-A-disaccharide synthase
MPERRMNPKGSSMPDCPKVLICSGDASGDLLAADFVRSLRSRCPGTRFFGIGGDQMQEEKVELLVHQRNLAVGLLNILPSLRRIVSAWLRLSRALREEKPDLVVLVDSPDFNLPFARKAAKSGVPVLYYVSPQVWAWRKGRISKIAKRVDRLAVIFPFEAELYAGTGLQVDFVGHPLVDRIGRFRDQHQREACRVALGLDLDAPLLLLMPGSRRNEIQFCLAPFLESARLLHIEHPEVHMVLSVAPTIERAAVEEGIRLAALPDSLRLDVIQGKSYELIRAADLALAKPGTSTMELAIFGCPFVVSGKTTRFTYFISRFLLHLTALAMPNLIAGRHIVPELVQDDADPRRISEALTALLNGPARETQQRELAAVTTSLGEGGAADRTAAIAEEMMGALAKT